MLLRVQARAELRELGVAGLFAVGHEGSQLLCAAAEEGGGTAVFSYDLGSERLAPLYVHKGAGRVVGASLDAGSALLAVTTEEQRSREGGEAQAYFKVSSWHCVALSLTSLLQVTAKRLVCQHLAHFSPQVTCKCHACLPPLTPPPLR